MKSHTLELEPELVALLLQSNQSIAQSIRELLVLELYRRGTLSSGKAAQLLAMPRLAFLHHAASLGIFTLDMTEDEWETESQRSEAL
jgi:predicted HTH domain antitoxin